MSPEKMKHMVRWGDTEIEWEEAKRRAEEAKELSKGIDLITSEQRTWYEDNYTAYVTNYFGLARLIEKIRGEKK